MQTAAAVNHAAAQARFPECNGELAIRLAKRYSDAAAVCAADDRELLSLRGLGPVQFVKLRARYPRPDEPVAHLSPDKWGVLQGELHHPLRSGARSFAPSREDYDK